ncbi:hypothetical protein VP01_293g4 [Puccinia sorghi]|uniref:Uncharacterized protein n=1 Tax=Puccinia sorghi TaxID=27349 RepID=A0A0L6V1U4_9BASI|nr:hypothetical protein VP01_293g4 [Puccinia sorghi]
MKDFYIYEINGGRKDISQDAQLRIGFSEQFTGQYKYPPSLHLLDPLSPDINLYGANANHFFSYPFSSIFLSLSHFQNCIWRVLKSNSTDQASFEIKPRFYKNYPRHMSSSISPSFHKSDDIFDEDLPANFFFLFFSCHSLNYSGQKKTLKDYSKYHLRTQNSAPVVFSNQIAFMFLNKKFIWEYVEGFFSGLNSKPSIALMKGIQDERNGETCAELFNFSNRNTIKKITSPGPINDHQMTTDVPPPRKKESISRDFSRLRKFCLLFSVVEKVWVEWKWWRKCDKGCSGGIFRGKLDLVAEWLRGSRFWAGVWEFNWMWVAGSAGGSEFVVGRAGVFYLSYPSIYIDILQISTQRGLKEFFYQQIEVVEAYGAIPVFRSEIKQYPKQTEKNTQFTRALAFSFILVFCLASCHLSSVHQPHTSSLINHNPSLSTKISFSTTSTTPFFLSKPNPLIKKSKCPSLNSTLRNCSSIKIFSLTPDY